MRWVWWTCFALASSGAWTGCADDAVGGRTRHDAAPERDSAAPDPCASVLCPPGRVCSPETGACVSAPDAGAVDAGPAVCTTTPCIAAGLVAHWAFEGSMEDRTGGGNDGRGLDGEPEYVAGVSGTAARLDGHGDAVAVDGTAPVLGVLRSNVFTVAGFARHRPRASGEARFLWSFDRDGDRDLFYVGIKSSDVLQLRNGNSASGANLEINVPLPTTAESWHHIAATADGVGNWVLYVDGCPHHTGPTATATPLSGGDCFVIGAEQRASCVPGDPLQNWRGDVDEISVFDRALGPAEIAFAASLATGSLPSCE